MSVIYRDRDRDRYDDSRTSVSTSRRDGGYTTVKRYIVKDDDSRSSVGRDRDRDRDRRFVPERAGERVEETRIIRREREVDEPVRDARRDEPRYSTSELVIRRDRDDDGRRDTGFDRRRDDASTDRDVVGRRTNERDDSRRDDLQVSRLDDRRDYRYRDDYEVLSPGRGGFDDRDKDIQRYTRTAEYFSPPQQPQTIIIRNEPIIIRERVRDDDYQIVRKSDVEDDRAVVRRQPERDPPREEDYFYEKKIRERIDEPPARREERDDEYYEKKSMRREISPHDSVSQVGRGRRDYSSSDDSMVYVRRTREEESRSASPDRRKSLAAGIVAGVGAAELLRNHKKKEGRETSHGAGRLGRDVGAGALGAIAAAGIERARSMHRSRSRRGDRDRDRDRDRDSRSSRSRSRKRSRSDSRSRLKTLGAVGLGAAALAAAAAVAQKRMSKKDDEPSRRGRSSSRHRTESVEELANDPTADDARNPKHRNKRMAEAGAAGAVITALIDRARSKSRAREGGRERSRSRIRQAVPVIAAGLGSAALAGLYEKNKAKKEAEVVAHEERRRSRSRSRQGSEYFDGPRDAAVSDPGLIEYGDGPMYGNNYGEGYYGRAPPQENFYGPQTAVVPAVAPAVEYGAAREARSRSRSVSRDRRSRRSLSRSSSGSAGGRGSRRHQSRDAATTAAAAGGGAIAATEYERRKQEKRERKARKRQQEAHGRDPYEDLYNPTSQPFTPTPPPAADPYATQTGYYPQTQTSQFPPPPGSVPQQYATAPQPAAAGTYNPQDFPPPPTHPGVPGYDPYAPGANPYAPRPRGADENVSAGNSFPQHTPNHSTVDGVNVSRSVPPPSINIHPPSISSPNPAEVPTYIPPTERSVSPNRSASQPPPSNHRKSVQFAANPDVQTVAPESEASSPEQPRQRRHNRTARGYEAGDDTDSTPDDMRRRSQARTGPDPNLSVADESRNGRGRHHRRRRSRSHDPSSPTSRDGPSTGPDRVSSPADSDATVEMPARFDREGQKKTEPGDDPLADRIDEILSGKGTAGKVFGNFMDGLFGPDGRKKGGK